MDPSCLVSTVQVGGGGVMVWGPLVPIEHRLNTTAYLSIVAEHVHPFMTTVYPSSDGYFQQNNATCHKAQIISDWFLELVMELILLKCPPQSADFNPIESTFGMWWNGRFTSWMCSRKKSAATAWCYHVNMDQIVWGMFPTPCWIYAT